MKPSDTATDARAIPLLDIHGIAERLGVSERHVRRLVAERRIPYLKWGHLLRFDPNDIDAWLETVRRPAVLTMVPASGVVASPAADPGRG